MIKGLKSSGLGLVATLAMVALGTACKDSGEGASVDDARSERALEVEWTQKLSTSVDDVAEAVAADGDAVYVVGSTQGELCDGCNLGSEDAFLQKYGADGEIAWTRQFGTEGADRAFAVAVDDGAIYVTGSTRGDMAGEAARAEADSLDTFIQKYADDGELVWTRQFGTTFERSASGADDVPAGIAADDGAVVIAGESTLAMGNPNRPARRAMLRMLDADGGLVWADDFLVESGPTRALAVALYQGAVYVSGDKPLTTSSVQAGWDAFLRRYDASGHEQWTERFERTEGVGSDSAVGVAVDEEAVYVVGESFDMSDQTASNRHFLSKFDPAGAEQWTRFHPAPADALALADGGVYVAGDAPEAAFNRAAARDRAGLQVRHYNPDGDLTFDGSLETDNGGHLSAMAATDEAIYLVGTTNGGARSISSNSRDGFLIKLDAD